MPKARSHYVCQQCGYKSPSFLGKCPECGAWNSLVETVERDENATARWGSTGRDGSSVLTAIRPVRLSDVAIKTVERISSGIREVDQVLGGTGGKMGFVPGSLILLAGDPGIGKSTLTLQILSHVGGLYVTGEESSAQVKLRAERLGVPTANIFILPETNIEAIVAAATKKREDIKLLIVDSVQTLWSEELTGAAGSVGQVRESTLRLLDLAKRTHLPVLLIGHVTKEGTIAGPKVLEHIVDAVFYLEGDRFQALRLLRSNKNRFGPVDEVGVFSMEEGGMQEVANPSELFLGKPESAAGSVIIATLEGTRPMLVEVQALCVSSPIPVPRRIGNGISTARLQMLTAILQKHIRAPLGSFDVFVNVASGLKVIEPAADLGICLAIASSLKNKVLPPKTVAIGEVGLLGEIRNVIGVARRIKEAKRLGYTTIISPQEHTHLSSVVKTFLA